MITCRLLTQIPPKKNLKPNYSLTKKFPVKFHRLKDLAKNLTDKPVVTSDYGLFFTISPSRRSKTRSLNSLVTNRCSIRSIACLTSICFRQYFAIELSPPTGRHPAHSLKCSSAFVSTHAITPSKQSMGIIRRSLSKLSDVYSNLSLL
jgi:hypothetical protein